MPVNARYYARYYGRKCSNGLIKEHHDLHTEAVIANPVTPHNILHYMLSTSILHARDHKPVQKLPLQLKSWKHGHFAKTTIFKYKKGK